MMLGGIPRYSEEHQENLNKEGLQNANLFYIFK